MKIKKYFILFAFILTTSIYSQEFTDLGLKYTLIAKLKKDYNHRCDCQSLIIINKLFDFKVLKLNYKEYWSKSINIIIPCPESYGDIGYQKSLESAGYSATAIQVDTRGTARVNFYTGSSTRKDYVSIKYKAFKKLK